MSKGEINPLTVEAFSELAKLLPEPALLVAGDGRILAANPPFCRILSVTREQLTGVNLAEISSSSPEKLRRYLQNCARSRQMIFGALELRGDGGDGDDDAQQRLEYRCEGAVVTPAKTSNDGSGGVVVTSPAEIFLRLKPKQSADRQFTVLTQKIDELNREVVERRRAEEESRRLYREAKEANRLKDEFLATVSHELRTPLNAILGWARMLRTHNLDSERFAAALETIERNARSQNQLVEDLLDVSSIITGKLRLDVRPIEIASVVEAAVESLRPAAENKSVRLQMIVDPRAGLISGDGERLQQTIWNLLSNAIKFTPKNGRVQVRLERVNSHVEITVSDTGVGIEPEFLPYVFDRFRQADGTKTRKHGGLGLGLAIVRHLVELHGGTTHVFSDGLGQGSTFTIKLPMIIVRKSSERAFDENGNRIHPTAFDDTAAAENPSERPSLGALRLLVLDDEPDAREMMRVLLESYGAEVSLSATAADAFEKLCKDRFDVLISDIEMPDEDGYSLVKKLRAAADDANGAGGCAKIAAVALTAHARAADRLRALSAGFDSHVAKPFDPAELIAVIVGLVRRIERS